MIKLVLVLTFCLFGVQAQVPVVGKCPEIASVQQDFDLNKYLGTWYEEEKYFFLFEIGGRCNSAEYSLNENGTVRVYNTQIEKSSGKLSTIEGYAKPASSGNEGKFVVNFPGRGVQVDAPYWVLETDYENYSVVWSCVNIPPISTEFAWILTRERNPSQEVVDKAHAVFDRLNLNRKALIKTDQTQC